MIIPKVYFQNIFTNAGKMSVVLDEENAGTHTIFYNKNKYINIYMYSYISYIL